MKMRGWFAIPLWPRVLGGLVLGLLLALLWPAAAPNVAFLGDLFVRAIRMLVALIFVTILVGVGTVVAGDAGKPFAGLLQSLSALIYCASRQRSMSRRPAPASSAAIQPSPCGVADRWRGLN